MTFAFIDTQGFPLNFKSYTTVGVVKWAVSYKILYTINLLIKLNEYSFKLKKKV